MIGSQWECENEPNLFFVSYVNTQKNCRSTNFVMIFTMTVCANMPVLEKPAAFLSSHFLLHTQMTRYVS